MWNCPIWRNNFSLVTKDKMQKVLEILKKYDDGIIITSKIDNSGARLE